MSEVEKSRFIQLLECYIQGQVLSEKELDQLVRGMQDPDCLQALDDKMFSELEGNLESDLQSEELSASFQQEALVRFKQKLELHKAQDEISAKKLVGRTTIRSFWTRTVVAAFLGTLLLLTGVVLYLVLSDRQPPRIVKQTEKYQRLIPIVPGSSGAILTLGNGRKIALGTTHKGLMHIGSLTIQQNKQTAKFTNNLLGDSQVLYNTLTTPRGRQFQVELPDGTKVWLNASSTLIFPTVFNKSNRTVELSGEAYFEVVHNANSPFRVRANGQLIEDIGTKFNVKAYLDDPEMMTALVEGAVDISNRNKTIRLSPGQQVKIKDQQMLVSKANINQILAWKSGFFAFQNASVQDIMRQLSRWYDVDVSYANDSELKKGNLQKYTGRIDRNLDLQDLIDGLQFAQMHFKIDKNKRTIIIDN